MAKFIPLYSNKDRDSAPQPSVRLAAELAQVEKHIPGVEDARKYINQRLVLNAEGPSKESFERVASSVLMNMLTKNLGYLVPKGTDKKTRDIYKDKSDNFASIIMDITHDKFVLCKSLSDFDNDTFIKHLKDKGILLGIELGSFRGPLPTNDVFLEVFAMELKHKVDGFNKLMDTLSFDMESIKIL